MAVPTATAVPPQAGREPGAAGPGNAGAGSASLPGTAVPGAAASGTAASGTAGLTASGVAVAGVWQGTYICSQGITGLTLRITDAEAGSSAGAGAGAGAGSLAATFDFYPVPENPSVPRGSFTMVGSVRGNLVTLDGHAWVTRPPGYEMVNLTGTPAPGTPDSFDGGIRGVAGCTGFSVHRAPAGEH